MAERAAVMATALLSWRYITPCYYVMLGAVTVDITVMMVDATRLREDSWHIPGWLAMPVYIIVI